MTEIKNIMKLRAEVQRLRILYDDQRDANLDELIAYIDEIIRHYDNTEVNPPQAR